MATFIRDYAEKIDVIIAVLNDFHADQTLSIINSGRHEKLSNEGLRRKHIMQVMGMPESHASNWKNYINFHNQGFAIMLAQFAGFGPTDATIAELPNSDFAKTRISQTGKAKVFPKLALQALDEVEWFAGDRQKKCWLAFAGNVDAILEDKVLAELEASYPSKPLMSKDREVAGEIRGTTADRFAEVFKIFSRDHPPTLPCKAYCAQGNRANAPSLISNRAGEFYTSIRSDVPKVPLTVSSATVSVLTGNGFDVPAAFSSHLPKRRTDPATEQQKFSLYGGGLANDFGYDPVRHVINGHSFSRSTANRIEQTILKQDVPFSAITVRAQHGEGLSFALAEVAVSLAQNPEFSAHWVIGDLNKTIQFVKEIPEFLDRNNLREHVNNLSPQSKIVLIVDDISEVSDIPSVQDFHEELESCILGSKSISATIVYGVFGSFYNIADCIDIDLELSDDDQYKCYQKMSYGQLNILDEGTDSFLKITTEHPISRSYANDTQAFIDYLLEYGRRTKVADHNWLSKTNETTEWECSLLENTAASGILGLGLQENVALLLANWAGLENVYEVEGIARNTKYLTVVEDEWRGLSLTSPRRAASILKRLNKDGTESLSQKLYFLFETALDCYEEGGPGATDSLEYGRHILQRLNKKELYQIPQKGEISEIILERSIDRIDVLSEGFEPTTAAKWAGSLCPLFPIGTNAHHRARPTQLRLADLTLNLVQGSLSKSNAKADPPPEMALSIFKSLRRLGQSSLTKEAARQLLMDIETWLTEDALIRFVDAIAATEQQKLEYRLNEIFLASSNLREMCRGAANLHLTENWFSSFETKMSTLELNLDAGSWLKRAENSTVRRDKSLYFEIAEASAIHNHRGQASWLNSIRKKSKAQRAYNA